VVDVPEAPPVAVFATVPALPPEEAVVVADVPWLSEQALAAAKISTACVKVHRRRSVRA
jgi:uncharacterized membrane protein YcfT